MSLSSRPVAVAQLLYLRLQIAALRRGVSCQKLVQPAAAACDTHKNERTDILCYYDSIVLLVLKLGGNIMVYLF